MGAHKSRMSQYIDEEEVNKQIPNSKLLQETYRYYQNNGSIGLHSFSHLIRKPNDPEFCLAIFKLFKSKKEGLTFTDYKIFYHIFTSKYSKFKIIFISELIFEDNSSLSKEAYGFRVRYFFKQTKLEELFKEEVFVKEIKIEKNKGKNRDKSKDKDRKDNNNEINRDKEIFYSKELFILVCATMYISVFKTFTFINPVESAMDVKDPSDNKKISLHYNYVCNCIIAKKSEKEIKEAEDILLAEYDKMKILFEHIAYRNEGTFAIELLKDYFNKVNVKHELQIIILSYLRNITLRPFIDFTTFKSFMIQCTKSTDELCMLLFEMILYPAKEGKKNKIEKALNSKLTSGLASTERPTSIVNYIKDNDLMHITDALNYKETLVEFILSFDSINLIPYAYFQIKPLTLIQLNKVLEYLMMKLQWEDYLIEKIDKENTFYVINTAFWTAIEPSMSEELKPKSIDNKSLTPNGLFLTESNAIFKDNFILLPESIYAYMKKWFEVDTEISLTKNTIKKDLSLCLSQKKEEDECINFDTIDHDYNEHNTVNNAKSELNKVIDKGDYILISKAHYNYEIHFYPIQVDMYLLKKLYDTIEGKRNIKEKVNDKLNEMYQRETQLQQERKKKDGKLYSSNILFSEIKQEFSTLVPEPIRLFAYYNNHLIKLEDESTFQIENIKGYCILLIDSKLIDTDIYYYDIIHPPKIDPKMKYKKKKDKFMGNRKKESSSSVLSSISSISSSSISSNTVSSILNNENPGIPLGLCNLGNTCYFNSVLQIFLNLPLLNELFSKPKISYFINKHNIYGQKGKFINRYLTILEKRMIPHIPLKDYMNSVVKFNRVIRKINAQFNNCDQQDANEFFIFLLETFHEELNIKSKREYISNPPQLDNTEEELSNLNLANTIRRGASFIDALFLFQLKSNLLCSKCNTAKILFESNYILDIPVMVDTMIEVDVILHRLPFELKIYYDKVNKEFKAYNDKHKDKSINDNLREYSDQLIEGDLSPEKYYLSSRNTNVPITFKLKCDRTDSAESLLKRIRLFKTLELEPPVENKDVNENKEHKLLKTTCNELTTLIIYRVNRTKVSMETSIDDCFPSEKKLCIVYEHLNTNGLNILMKIQKETNLVRHKTKGTKIQPETFDEERKKQFNQNDCLCVSDYLLYYTKHEVTNEIGYNNNFQIEYVIDIEHYHVSSNQMSPFGIFYLNPMGISKEWIIINNSGKIKATTLYDIIWESNKRMLKSLRKKDKDLWWRYDTEDFKLNTFSIKKMCYPFILRYCLIESQIAKCGKCPWYSFCPGCLINPYNETYLIIPSNITIVVDWCIELVQTEFVQSYSNICYSFKDENVKIEGEIVKKYHTLDDCFNLFCEKEKLEDQIYCDICRSHQYFIKNYDLCKPPPVLIISLKRFKFNQHSRYKIRTFINYPINDMVIKGEKYNLYGIINHYGNIAGGHYTSMIKVNNVWMAFDDNRVCAVTKKQILTENAYLLVYCSVNSPMKKNYYRRLYSILSNIEAKNTPTVIPDNFFFFGEPVITPYGRGYCKETIEDDNRSIIPIKFAFGQGFIHRRNVIKETALEINHKEKDDNKEESDEEIQSDDENKSSRKINGYNSVIYDCSVF